MAAIPTAFMACSPEAGAKGVDPLEGASKALKVKLPRYTEEGWRGKEFPLIAQKCFLSLGPLFSGAQTSHLHNIAITRLCDNLYPFKEAHALAQAPQGRASSVERLLWRVAQGGGALLYRLKAQLRLPQAIATAFVLLRYSRCSAGCVTTFQVPGVNKNLCLAQ